MKKLLLLAAAVAALTISAGSAAAQAPAPAGQASCAQCADPGAGGGSPGYGYGYSIKGKLSGGWFGGKLAGLFSNHHGNGGPQVLPVAQGGQLAFPQNPFVRGPRDYFMWDEK